MNNEIAMFHIGRGGRFHNSGYLTFTGFRRIDECNDWGESFINNRDEKQRFCKPYMVAGNGHLLLDADELKIAMETGIGRLNFDYDYDTTYTTYTNNLNDVEIEAMRTSGQWGIEEVLEMYGITID